jgi:hypothetical protein
MDPVIRQVVVIHRLHGATVEAERGPTGSAYYRVAGIVVLLYRHTAPRALCVELSVLIRCWDQVSPLHHCPWRYSEVYCGVAPNTVAYVGEARGDIRVRYSGFHADVRAPMSAQAPAREDLVATRASSHVPIGVRQE